MRQLILHRSKIFYSKLEMFVNVAKNSLNQCHCCSMLYTKVIIKDEKNYLTLSFNEINIRLESKNK